MREYLLQILEGGGELAPLFADAGDECVVNFHRIAGGTAGTAADKYV